MDRKLTFGRKIDGLLLLGLFLAPFYLYWGIAPVILGVICAALGFHAERYTCPEHD